MRKISILILGLVIMVSPAFLLPANAAICGVNPTCTIFFDDFLSSQLSPSWTVNPNAQINNGNITQQAGYLTMTSQRFGNPGCSCTIVEDIVANQTGAPVIDSQSNGTFFQMSVKEIPFNMTSLPSTNINRLAETDIALLTVGGGGFGIQMIEQDLPGSSLQAPSNIGGLAGQKQAVGFAFNKPNSGANSGIVCYTSQTIFWNGCFGAGSTNKPVIIYSPNTLSNPIDLNANHIFSLRGRVWQGTSTRAFNQSWVAMQVDNFGWLNMSQAACLCISPAGSNFAGLFPTLYTAYCATGPGVGAGSCNKMGGITNQSLATNVDWVYITNFVPPSLPTGQIFSSPSNPSTSLNQPAVGSFDLGGFLIFEANSFAPGNVYAGGMALTGLFSLLIFTVMGLGAKKTGLSLQSFGMLFTISVLGLAFFGFVVGILPLWIPAMTVIIVVAIVFGVIKSHPAEGGVVQA